MEGKDSIKDLFNQKLGNYEVPVNPEVWTSISSQISTVGSSSAAGISILTKILIGSSIAASIAIGSYFILENSENKTKVKDTTSIKREKDNNNLVKEVNQISKKKLTVDIQKNYYKNIEIILDTNTTIGLNINALSSIINSTNSTESNSEEKNVITSDSEIKQVQSFSKEQNINKEDEITETGQNLINNSKLNAASEESKNPPKLSEITLNLPNIFTPNGDGRNDYLEIDAKDIEDFSIVVLNDKGQTVFQSIDNEFRWDGRMPNGDLVETGNFIYYITGKDNDGKLVTKYTRLTIKF
jgi:gliding motility-associated-like protein